MKWLIRVLVGLVGLFAAVMGIGSLRPTNHSVSRFVEFTKPPEQVWPVIVDRLSQPAWRLDVTKVESAASPSGKPRWKETMSDGMVVTMEERAIEPNRKLMVDIADPDLPFGGTWTYQLSPTAKGGSRLQITEDGFVKPALYRFVMIFMDPADTMSKYLTYLGRKLGENVTPQAVN
ncbi:MAG: SRPBCC family protein [Bryobacteraceae bacterium]|nr:SRPBCC family protein [Bryobacteraceae bacterium]